MFSRENASEYGLFAKRYIKNPFSQSSLVPTSWPAIEELSRSVSGKTKRIVELGPGTGRLPYYLSRNNLLGADARYVGIDLDKEFVDFSCKRIQDPRITMLHDSAMRLREIAQREFGDAKVDRIFASLPFSLMKETRDPIFAAVKDVLADDGLFIVYIFRRIKDELKEFFDDVSVRSFYANFPPLQIHVAKKKLEIISVVHKPLANGFHHRNGLAEEFLDRQRNGSVRGVRQ